MKKYKFGGEKIEFCGRILKRIVHLKTGKLGGFIESETNLDHTGECWVADDAKVFGSSYIAGNALIKGSAVVSSSFVNGTATVGDNACICNNSFVREHANVLDNVTVLGNSVVSGCSTLTGNFTIENTIITLSPVVLTGLCTTPVIIADSTITVCDITRSTMWWKTFNENCTEDEDLREFWKTTKYSILQIADYHQVRIT